MLLLLATLSLLIVLLISFFCEDPNITNAFLIEQVALSRMELLTSQMAKAEGVTEELKASDPMKWTGLMNNIRHSAEETVLNELICN